MPDDRSAASYVYALVRQDLPLAAQLVQAAHACLEAGSRYPLSSENPNIVLLAIPNEKHLHIFLGRLDAAGIRYVLFHEPDDCLGDTAACTEPLTADHRGTFQRVPLWHAPTQITKT